MIMVNLPFVTLRTWSGRSRFAGCPHRAPALCVAKTRACLLCSGPCLPAISDSALVVSDLPCNLFATKAEKHTQLKKNGCGSCGRVSYLRITISI